MMIPSSSFSDSVTRNTEVASMPTGEELNASSIGIELYGGGVVEDEDGEPQDFNYLDCHVVFKLNLFRQGSILSSSDRSFLDC